MYSYQNIYEGFIFPFAEKVKGRSTAVLYRSALETQWESSIELERRQLESLNFLCRYAYQHSKFYRSLFDAHGIIPSFKSFGELEKIPILTKEIITKNFQDIITKPHEKTIWYKSTGGSTGQPLHFGYSKESYAWRVAMSKRGYSWAGSTPGTKQAFIWGVPLTRQGVLKSIKNAIINKLHRQTFFNCFEFDEQAMSHCFRWLNSMQPGSIIGYTNPLYEFAKYVDANGGLDYSPKAVICAAEKLHPHQRYLIEKVFNCKAFDTYGSREFMLIASECSENKGMHISMENLYVEIVTASGLRAKDGEPGNIVITDLHNFAFPFIRYEIGDVGVASSRLCPCGRGLHMIDSITGRSLDMIRLADGTNLPGEFFPHLMLNFVEVKKFQVEQTSYDKLVVRIVPLNDPHSLPLDAIRQAIQKNIGSGVGIDFVVLEDIPLTRTGKYRVTISNCF